MSHHRVVPTQTGSSGGDGDDRLTPIRGRVFMVAGCHFIERGMRHGNLIADAYDTNATRTRLVGVGP